MRHRFLRSKIRVQKPHPDVIERPRLVGRLIESDLPVRLVSAPAGFGKTVLLRQAARAFKGSVAWVGIDEADNDPARFWTHVSASIVGSGDRLDELLDQLAPGTLDSTIDGLIREIENLNESVMLVLDDLHEVENLEALAGLGRIAARPPINLTLLIGSRSDPPISIGRLRAQGILLEIRSSDLAFLPDETAACFEDSIGVEEAESLTRQTNGWPTAIRMISVAGGKPGEVLRPDAYNQNLAEYLAGEVLEVQEDSVRDFLVRTSIVDELAPGLCDELMGKPGSLAVLRDLARRQVFTDLVDSDSDLFRYHPLFRGLLRSRAEELDPATAEKLHSAAARWFARDKQPGSAVRHSMAAGDDGFALDIIQTNFLEWAQAGYLATVNSWLVLFGEANCRASPRIRNVPAWIALNARQYVEVDRLLSIDYEPFANQSDNTDHEAESAIIRSHLARHRGNLSESLRHAELGVSAAQKTGGVVEAAGYSALCQIEALAGRRSMANAERSIATGIEWEVHDSVVMGYASQALIESLDPDRLEEADVLADLSLAFITSATEELFYQPTIPLLVKARVAMASGQLVEAETYVERATEIAQVGLEPLALTLVYCLRARLAHLRADQDQVREYVKRAEDLVADGNSGKYLEDEVRECRNSTRFVSFDGLEMPPQARLLTEAELAILRVLPYRLSRRELAAQQYVSENTIKTHLTSIRHKLGISGRSDIVERARELGLLD